jgi:dihydrofolate reductase
MISMIVAMGENNAIGKDNDLLWHLPDDFKHFKSVTMGKPIVMGRKTYESIGRPLPGRENIVVTHDDSYVVDDVTVVHSIDAALEACEKYDDVMVIGGASFYQQMMLKAERLYITMVHQSFEADAFFPSISETKWREIDREEHVADEKHRYNFSFITYERV